MAAQVKWTAEAEKALDEAVYQCWQKFGGNVSAHFYDQVKNQDRYFATDPNIEKLEPLLAHKSHAYRSLVVHKLYKIVYYIDADAVYIVDLWDVRRNPDALAERIR